MKQLKDKGQQDFNEWVDRLSSELNHLKAENEDLNIKLSKVKNEYEQYQQLWN